jgi:ankyrin repeat protein
MVRRGPWGRWEFHEKAVTPDHVERLRYLLDLGLDPAECNFVGRSLITEAASAGDPARVQLLLDRGASATAVPVQSRVRGKMPRLTPIPLPGEPENSAKVPRGDADSYQIPLFCAAQSGSAECVELILRAGADPNTRDSSGKIALMVSGSPAVVRTLLQAGADLHATDEFGNDAFQAAIEGSCDSDACGAERFEVAQALLEAGVDIERVDQYGKTRLASAAFGHHADAVEFLINLGAKADAADAEGGTPLHSICWQGESDEERNRACEQIIRALIRAGTDVDAVDRRGMTAMYEAAYGDWGNQTAIRTLLELGADPDPVDDDGDTPLLLAAANGATECVQVLLQAGADPTRRNRKGRSALDAARDHLGTWESIVAEGPDGSIAEMLNQMKEHVTKELSGLFGGEKIDLSEMLGDQGKQHQSELDAARKTLEAITLAVEKRLETEGNTSQDGPSA